MCDDPPASVPVRVRLPAAQAGTQTGQEQLSET